MDAEFSHGLNFYLSNYPFYSQLTPQLKNEVSIGAAHVQLFFILARDYVSKFDHVFSDPVTEFRCGPNFVRKFMAKLQLLPFPADTAILDYGERTGEVYLIYLGSVSFVQVTPQAILYDKNTDIHLAEIPEGSYFGDVPVLLDVRSTFKYKTGHAATHLLFSAKKEELDALFTEFPEEHAFFKERAMRRRRYLKKLRDFKRILFLCSYFNRTQDGSATAASVFQQGVF